VSALPSETPDLIGLLGREQLTIGDLPEDDDGTRHELIDGGLHVTPLGESEHQDMVGLLCDQLRGAVPGHLRVLPGVNVIAGERTMVQPDVAVADPKHVVRGGLGVSPRGLALVIEITSPSTARKDLTLKRDLYEEWSVPYLIVDRRRSPYTLKTYGVLPEWAQLSL
jgi:Uma2 family endonuclease